MFLFYVAINNVFIVYMWVLGLTLDGASVNRSLVKLHQLQTDPIPYRTINPFAENNRHLFFLMFLI